MQMGKKGTAAVSLTDALDLAIQLCEARGARLTSMRRSVLETLLAIERPITAYELRPLLESSLQRRVMPVTIYRALDFLVRQHFATRIESRNAYVACAHPERAHECVFFVCDRCDTSSEVENPALETLISRDAEVLGFKVERQVVELQGVCASCRARPVIS